MHEIDRTSEGVGSEACPGATRSGAIRRGRERGITLVGLLFWAIVIGFIGVLVVKVFPTVNEYYTIDRTVNAVAKSGATTVGEVRAAFAKQAQIQYGIESITADDLQITKENEKIVISFAYDKQIPIVGWVYLLIKYQGRSR